MKTMCAVLLVVTLVYSGLGSARADSEIERVEVSTPALSWLSFIDRGEYGDSWKEASTYFSRSRV